MVAREHISLDHFDPWCFRILDQSDLDSQILHAAQRPERLRLTINARAQAQRQLGIQRRQYWWGEAHRTVTCAKSEISSPPTNARAISSTVALSSRCVSHRRGSDHNGQRVVSQNRFWTTIILIMFNLYP